jgi:hypothetical protein
MAIWYTFGDFEIFSRFGILNQEKSGNPGPVMWVRVEISMIAKCFKHY